VAQASCLFLTFHNNKYILLWNRLLACYGRASSRSTTNIFYCGIGILPILNGLLARSTTNIFYCGTGILPVIENSARCQFHQTQPQIPVFVISIISCRSDRSAFAIRHLFSLTVLVLVGLIRFLLYKLSLLHPERFLLQIPGRRLIFAAS